MSGADLEPSEDRNISEAPPPSRPPAKGIRRVVYLVLAAIFFALGAAGVILPGLPTTPFLLLTSFFLLRTSPGLNQRMLDSRLFGPILTDWQERGGVRRHVKVKAIGVVVIAIGLMLWLSPLSQALKLVAGTAGVIGVLVILSLREV